MADSEILSWIAIFVSVISAGFAGYQALMARRRDQREAAQKQPLVDLVFGERNGRDWLIELAVTNRGDSRLQIMGFQMMDPPTAYVMLNYRRPLDGSQTVQDPQFGRNAWTTAGAIIQPGQTVRLTGGMNVPDMVPLTPGMTVKLRMALRHYDAKAGDIRVSIVRELPS
jgi:hypothetical protein